MILRFENKETKNCINIDTNREEQSEQRVAGKNYIEVDAAGFEKICCELDFIGCRSCLLDIFNVIFFTECLCLFNWLC